MLIDFDEIYFFVWRCDFIAAMVVDFLGFGQARSRRVLLTDLLYSFDESLFDFDDRSTLLLQIQTGTVQILGEKEEGAIVKFA